MSPKRLASRFGVKVAFAAKQWGPFKFEVDRPKGFVKTWDQPDGSVKKYEYPVDYGYFINHTGEDQEGLDAFIGDDPAGKIEKFLKLKEVKGEMVPDETKFMIGLTPEERAKVIALYKPEEIIGMREYDDFYELVADLNAYKDRKKLATVMDVDRPSNTVCNYCGSTMDYEDGHDAYHCPVCNHYGFNSLVVVPNAILVRMANKVLSRFLESHRAKP